MKNLDWNLCTTFPPRCHVATLTASSMPCSRCGLPIPEGARARIVGGEVEHVNVGSCQHAIAGCVR